ncbi:uncharacterized protein LOC125093322 isoform X4 [Lutra lutra]|uniref:uncharacterized protein LOC125093322 isoform X4 n=1 Tax=Lutra lutra TaxID=9657 RepID=UPI001FD57C17|nr:uncharacterized protein LOC125093322 isoform X4 [Lutra lutra]
MVTSRLHKATLQLLLPITPFRHHLSGPRRGLGERAGARGVFSKSPTSRREIRVMPHALCVHLKSLLPETIIQQDPRRAWKGKCRCLSSSLGVHPRLGVPAVPLQRVAVSTTENKNPTKYMNYWRSRLAKYILF